MHCPLLTQTSHRPLASPAIMRHQVTSTVTAGHIQASSKCSHTLALSHTHTRSRIHPYMCARKTVFHLNLVDPGSTKPQEVTEAVSDWLARPKGFPLATQRRPVSNHQDSCEASEMSSKKMTRNGGGGKRHQPHACVPVCWVGKQRRVVRDFCACVFPFILSFATATEQDAPNLSIPPVFMEGVVL